MPQWLLPYVPLAALGISAIALLISFLNLGWNIYREVALRGRLNVQFGVKEIISPGEATFTRVVVAATNHGPGSVTVSMIIYKKRGGWRSLPWRSRLRYPIRCLREYGVVLHDWTEPLSHRLPHKLEVGDTINLVLKYGPHHGLKLTPNITRMGLVDSFGRRHWAPREAVPDYLKQWKKDFPDKPPGA